MIIAISGEVWDETIHRRGTGWYLVAGAVAVVVAAASLFVRPLMGIEAQAVERAAREEA